MLFNSFVFAGLFLPICLMVFWSAPSSRSKRAVLLLASLLFYSYWLPSYLILLIGLVSIAWACALLSERTNASWPVWLAAILLFGALGYFKYADFLVQIGIDLGLDYPGFRVNQIALPLGISFIVFQAMGYVIDVYRREFPAEKRFSIVLLFKAFFPQLIAGPICRAHELMPQLKGNFSFKLEQFTSGIAIFALGFFLKKVFADELAPLVDTLYITDTTPTLTSAWAAAIGFGWQIYADFWGYSTMAVGLARMFSIDIPINFNLPYFSASLREFWRRWHITLSQWLRDYLYKPLGGSRHGTIRMVFALMVTMLLGGLWHGANYTFIVWGAIHAIALILEHLLMKKPPTIQNKLHWLFGWIYTSLVVLVAWVFFRAADVSQALQIISAMFSISSGNMMMSQETRQVVVLALALFIIQIPAEWTLEQLRSEQLSPSVAIGIAFWAILAAIVLGAPVAIPFIYFQF